MSEDYNYRERNLLHALIWRMRTFVDENHNEIREIDADQIADLADIHKTISDLIIESGEKKLWEDLTK